MNNISQIGTKVNWWHSIRIGLISGIVLLYLGMVGMISAFLEREVIYGVLHLAQLILLIIPFTSAYLVARRMREEKAGIIPILLATLIASLLSLLPTMIMARLSQPIPFYVNVDGSWVIQDISLGINSILTNLNRDWLTAISFDNPDFWAGFLQMAMVSAAMGILGGIIAIIPEKPRGALLRGFIGGLMLIVFGETMRLILQETMSDAILDVLFRRSVFRPVPASTILGGMIVLSFLWTYLRKNAEQTSSDKPKVVGKPTVTQRVLAVLLVLFLLVLPVLVGRAISDVMVLVGIYILMGFGLNIAIGLAGLLDLGYVTNFAVGAYVMGILTSTGTLGLTDGAVNFWVALPIAMLAAMFTGFIFAVPVLKMRGDYLAIATLGFGEIIGKLAVSDWLAPIIGGAQGLLAIPKPVVAVYRFGEGDIGFWISLIIPVLLGLLAVFLWRYGSEKSWIFPVRIGTIIALIVLSGILLPVIAELVSNPSLEAYPLQAPEQLYYIVLVACALTLFVSIRLNNSRIGRQWMAIREDEDVATAMGIDTARSKLLAFTLSAATGGIAGGIFAAKVGTVFPNSFLVFVSINVLALIIVGGLGNNTGIVVGALILVGMPELLREFSEFRFLLYGVLLIFMMLNRPEGFLPSQVRLRELHDAEPAAES